MKQIDISQMKYIKQDKTVMFTCIRCNQSKTAKKYAECIIDGETHRICNGCYGNLLSMTKETEGITDSTPMETMKVSAIKVPVSDLTDEEIEYICRRITPKEIRAYFQKNPKQFAKIRPGFRAETLLDEDTITLIYKNTSNHFISSYLEKWLKQWLLEIRDFRIGREKDGVSPEQSLLEALPKSVFSDNVDLYFKVLNEQFSSEYIALVKTALTLASETPVAEETQETVSSAFEDISAEKEKNIELLALVEQLREEVATEKALHEGASKSLSEATTAMETIQGDLTTAISKNAALTAKIQTMQAELDHFYQLSKYIDVEPENAYSEEYEYTSLCEVFYDHDKIWLSRLADIHGGKIIRFTKVDSSPYFFGNRDRLFWTDGPKENGFIGIWQWNAVPRDSDPSKDFVTTSYIGGVSAIEVIELAECHTYEDIAQTLVTKAFPAVSGRKRLFTCRDIDGQIIGLLCNEFDFVVNNGEAKLKTTVYTLPCFEISSADILSVAGRKIYGFTKPGVPKGVFQVRNPLAVVKEVIITRATSAVLRQQGLSKKEAQHCQQFLRELPIQTVIQDIADAYSCEEAEARTYVVAFIEQADTYLTVSDIAVTTIAAALARNDELVLRCKELLSSEWETENADKMGQALKELEEIQAAVETQRAENLALQDEYRTLEEKKVAIQATIDEKLTLARDVESGVAERIDAARKNAAEFICTMAFSAPVHTTGESTPGTAVSLTKRKITAAEGEEIDDIDLFVDELAENLSAIGYEGVSAARMAQTVAFCIESHLPIICGTNAVKIADCIAAMFGAEGAYTATLAMNQPDCHDLCESIQTVSVNKTSVIVINGAFDGLSLNSFNQIKLCADILHNNAVLVFPLGGVDTSMLPHYLWGQAMFIDGDIGLENMETDDIVMHTSTLDFATRCTSEETANKRNQIDYLAGIISNVAMLNYARYMAINNSTLKDDDQVLLQVVLNALSSGKKEKLLEVLSSNGIDIQNNEDIARYL